MVLKSAELKRKYYKKYVLPEYYYLSRYSTPPTTTNGRSHTLRKMREVERSVACKRSRVQTDVFLSLD